MIRVWIVGCVVAGACVWCAHGDDALWRKATNVRAVAASNSRAEQKRAADWTCTGTNDERTISAAIASLTEGGTVLLLDGDYNVDAFDGEGNTAILFGYNGGNARTVTLSGVTENKSYNTRHGATIHVTKRAMDAMGTNGSWRVIGGTARKPKAEGDFFSYTHVNNANFAKFFILFHDASKPLVGIDGRNFGNMSLDLTGVYTESYFRDRFLHLKPATPCRGSVGYWSVPSSNDEMSRVEYAYANAGGLHTGFVLEGVDHLVMRSCSAARCCYGYVFKDCTKTLTMLNCCDEGNAHLPKFVGRGHLTAIDFNIESFNAAYIPDTPETGASRFATETVRGGWHGFISYTMQAKSFGRGVEPWGGPGVFWERGHGRNFRMQDLNEWEPLSGDRPLKARVELSATRLEDARYSPAKVFLTEEQSGGWPGDTEGRTILALALQEKALGRPSKHLKGILAALPKHLNEKGYMGPVRTDVADEQQMSGNGWLMRGLLACGTSETRERARGVARGLFLPAKGRFAAYPTDAAARKGFAGAASGSVAGTAGGWRLSTDIGCVFIGLDGLVETWRATRDADLEPVIDEMIARFLEIDLVGIRAQTHASLTALRAVLARDPAKYRAAVEKRFGLYVKHGMTDRYENYNWFDRTDTWTEPCAIADSFLLAHRLREATGNDDYLFYERKFLDALCAHQRSNGGFGLQKTFPRHSCREPEESCHEATWCCTMRGGAALAQALLWGWE